MFLAKHACATGEPDPVDGNHAVYHHELKSTLLEIGCKLVLADRYELLYERPDVDFVISLLNRGGFEHSEMLGPLLLTKHGIPFLGASPILRGLSDDKHLMKLAARGRGVPTADWKVFRRGSKLEGLEEVGPFPWVVKPNASSASWGVSIVSDVAEAAGKVRALWAQKQDVIVERWTPQVDIGVPVVGDANGEDWLLPAMLYQPEDDRLLRSYEEKRGLIETPDDPLVPVTEPRLAGQLEELTRALLPELWPFDYGRFEFRYDPATQGLSFMEVNLSCNLWSKKTISRSAGTLGISHAQLVENILAHSMARQGVSSRRLDEAA